MNIVFVGAGAVGCFYASRLHHVRVYESVASLQLSLLGFLSTGARTPGACRRHNPAASVEEVETILAGCCPSGRIGRLENFALE